METFFAEPLLHLSLMAIALIAGFVDSIAGGGGLITMPSLLSAGIPPHIVLGTNKLISASGTLIAALTYIRRRLFEPKLWIACALATLIGSCIGAILAKYLDASMIKKGVPIIIIGIAIYMLIPKKQAAHKINNLIPSKTKQVCSGLSLGLYDGLIGPGTGSFWTLLANSLFKQDLVRASGIARFMNLMSNISALATFFYLGMVDWRLGIMMGIANMLGAYIGAKSAIKYGAEFIRPLFIFFVVLIAGRLIYIEYLI
ncbi:TauE/TSUP family inner membrane protein [Gammaproteobacteria bacterium]|nr:TauE/TSUP family inner membrane protein [Gammaproteobacteria bacterium]